MHAPANAHAISPTLSPSLARVLRPTTNHAAWMYDVGLIAAGSLLIAASAYATVAVPISPVPITAQSLAILLIGALYGARRGAATVLAYLIQGAAGLPVFAGGHGGLAHLLGPTGGYLLGFLLAVIVVGGLSDRGWDRRFATTIVAMFMASVALFIPGLVWLAFLVGAERALDLGLWPFVPGGVLKMLIAAALLPVGWRVLRAIGWPQAR